MLSYVDDNNISNNGSTTETITEVLKRTQHDVQMWSDILRATGGTLNLSKCFCQAMTYMFSRTGAPVLAPADPSWNIKIKDDRDNSEQKIFNVISPYKTYKSLGTVQGNRKDHPEQNLVLAEKSQRITKELVGSGLSAKCAWVHYTAVFIPSITYPFSVTHMNVE